MTSTDQHFLATDHAAKHTSVAPTPAPEDMPIGDLVGRLSEDTVRLVRDEIQLARVEMTQKAKAAGIGAGLFGTAGVLAIFGIGVLIAAAVAALSMVLPIWAAALVVGGGLFAVAGCATLAGKREFGKAEPPLPTQAVESTKHDIDDIKRGLHA